MQSDFVTPEWNHSVYKKQTGKLYQFLSRSVTVFSQAWPRPRAWIKTPSSNGWRNFRPTELTIPGGDLQPQIRRLSSDETDSIQDAWIGVSLPWGTLDETSEQRIRRLAISSGEMCEPQGHPLPIG